MTLRTWMASRTAGPPISAKSWPSSRPRSRECAPARSRLGCASCSPGRFRRRTPRGAGVNRPAVNGPAGPVASRPRCRRRWPNWSVRSRPPAHGGRCSGWSVTRSWHGGSSSAPGRRPGWCTRTAGCWTGPGDAGLRLTEAGHLPPAEVSAAVHELKVPAPGGWPRENQVPRVRQLRESAQAMGLLRKEHGQLLVTTRGAELRSRPDALWWHLAERMPLRSATACEVQPGLILLVCVAARCTDTLNGTIARMLSAIGWMNSDGGPLTGAEASRATAGTHATLRWLGALPGETQPGETQPGETRPRSRRTRPGRRRREWRSPAPRCAAGPRRGGRSATVRAAARRLLSAGGRG